MEKEMRAAVAPAPKIQRSDETTDSGKIIGYAVKWDELSSEMWGFKEKFSRGAFSKALENPDVYASWNHDSSEILGRTPTTLSLVEDDIGLRYEITPPDWASRYVETIDRGDVRGSSFIFRPVKQEWDERNPDMAIRTITEAELFEVSPVTSPAYPTSSVGVRSAEAVAQEFLTDRNKAAIELRNKQRQRELDILSRG
jgi:HK97 family phage prohead protease